MDIILAITSLCTFVIVVFMLSKLSNYLNEKKKLEYLIPSNLRVPTDEELEIFNLQYCEVGKSCRTNKFQEYKKSLTNDMLVVDGVCTDVLYKLSVDSDNAHMVIINVDSLSYKLPSTIVGSNIRLMSKVIVYFKLVNGKRSYCFTCKP